MAKRKSDTVGEMSCSSNNAHTSVFAVRSIKSSSNRPIYKRSVKSKSGLSICKDRSITKSKQEIRRSSKTKYEKGIPQREKNISIVKSTKTVSTIIKEHEPLKMKKVAGNKHTVVSQKLFKTGSTMRCLSALLDR
jgi:hypothetical protein